MMRLKLEPGPFLWLIAAAGLVAAIWGVWNLVYAGDRRTRGLQLWFALIPASLGACGASAAVLELVEIGYRSASPSTGRFGAMVAFGVACGFWGLVGTTLAVVLGVCAVFRWSGRVPPQERIDRAVAAERME